MDNITKAEGFYYSINHLINAGYINSCDDKTMFAAHSEKTWGEICRNLEDVWGYGYCWDTPKLLKTSKLRDGRNNYVFSIRRL